MACTREVPSPFKKGTFLVGTSGQTERIYSNTELRNNSSSGIFSTIEAAPKVNNLKIVSFRNWKDKKK